MQTFDEFGQRPQASPVSKARPVAPNTEEGMNPSTNERMNRSIGDGMKQVIELTHAGCRVPGAGCRVPGAGCPWSRF